MAYAKAGLNPIGGQSQSGIAPAVWTYTSADAIAAVNSANYFNDASSTLKVRDIIFVVDSATPTLSIVSVLSNAAGVVDVSDGTTIAETDTD
tara:strand:+ start:172 stop:447 length:276 start_codon:yes stop_codon:yes gene_type:complete